jgi:hypothetical protein
MTYDELVAWLLETIDGRVEELAEPYATAIPGFGLNLRRCGDGSLAR